MSLPPGNVRVRCGQCGWHGYKHQLPRGKQFPTCPHCGTRVKAVVAGKGAT